MELKENIMKTIIVSYSQTSIINIQHNQEDIDLRINLF
jgi:hypothetical protein